jgi:predicted dithiol-disulfide oxidoreductase (DUF899 family)
MAMSFPNETRDYRAARDALLRSEVALRRQMEAVAEQFRALPQGGLVPEDYVFERIGADGATEQVTLSELFRGGDTLVVYHYMFPRHSKDDRPGPSAGEFAGWQSMKGLAPPARRSSTRGKAQCPTSKDWAAT